MRKKVVARIKRRCLQQFLRRYAKYGNNKLCFDNNIEIQIKLEESSILFLSYLALMFCIREGSRGLPPSKIFICGEREVFSYFIFFLVKVKRK